MNAQNFEVAVSNDTVFSGRKLWMTSKPNTATVPQTITVNDSARLATIEAKK